MKEIEVEMQRTQKNKATSYHLGRLKAQLAKLRTELLAPAAGAATGAKAGDGFEVSKYGHARVGARSQRPAQLPSPHAEARRVVPAAPALIGFPSVGKSTMLSQLTGTHSEQARVHAALCAQRAARKRFARARACARSTQALHTLTLAQAAYEFTTLTCIPGVIHYRDAKIQVCAALCACALMLCHPSDARFFSRSCWICLVSSRARPRARAAAARSLPSPKAPTSFSWRAAPTLLVDGAP
jgi:hypothetical protein